VPTYEYECGACGKISEVFQQITEDPLEKCPECGKRRLKRLIGGGAGFIFKGSGFYTTDYRSEDYKAKAKAESGGSSSNDGKDSSSSTEKKSDGSSSAGSESSSSSSSGSGSSSKESGSGSSSGAKAS